MVTRHEIFLPIIVALILAIGFITLSSAAPEELTRQLVWLGISILSCCVVFFLGQKRIVPYAFHFYLITLGLLVVTHFFGTEVNNARSWLFIGPLPGFQPSELSKITLLLALAASVKQSPIRNITDYIQPAFLVLIPCGLVILQPDLGSALVMLAIAAGIVLVRGIPNWHLLLLICLLIITGPLVIWPNLKPYQQDRITIFVNPERDPQNAGYQIIQSRIAIGSGGLTGKGYKQGTQSQFGFLPLAYADFIFSVLAEEGGFIASVALLLLYALLFWRLVIMAVECRRDRDQLIITGVMVFIGFQVLVNIGVALGLAPVTGITLPMVSYGGTSLLSTMLALSIVYVIHRDRFEEW